MSDEPRDKDDQVVWIGKFSQPDHPPTVKPGRGMRWVRMPDGTEIETASGDPARLRRARWTIVPLRDILDTPVEDQLDLE